MSDSVLLLGNYRSTLAAIRSVAGGYRVVLGTGAYTQGTELSRGVNETWRHPELEAPGFADALVGFLQERPDIRAVLPVSEDALVCTSSLRPRLPGHAVLASPAEATVVLCQDKSRSLQAATEAGVPTKPYAVVDRAGYDECCRALGTPLVIRPVVAPDRVFGRKAWIARTADELPPWPEEHSALLLQQFAAGPRHSLYFAAREGELLSLVDVKILRSDRWDGTGLGVEGITVVVQENLEAWMRALARRLDYTGIGCAQFLVPEDGSTPCYLELNPRMGGNILSATALGVEYPRYAVDLAVGRPISPPERYPVGVRYSWLYGDLAGMMHDELSPLDRLRWLSRTARAVVQADRDLVFDRHDPGPAIALYSGKLRALLGGDLR